MTSLLIHNSKIPDVTVQKFSTAVELIPNREQLSSDSFDYDFFYDLELARIFKDKQYSIIYISLNLSDHDYLELNGLSVANHIRLSPKWKHTQIPIILLGQESYFELMKLNNLSTLFLTPGIFLKNELIFEIESKGAITSTEYSKYLKNISIEPLANYQSHHSMANEWALTRYFSMFERDDANEYYNSLREKILELDYLKTLHFKYIEAKASREKFNPKKHFNTPLIGGIENMRIGLIDDEINKGWLAFYEYVFNKSQAQSIPFNDFRKDKSRKELIYRIQSWLLENFQLTEPIDLFIIDLRLHDDDFSEQNFSELSGVQIINFIKSKNPGIQIVVSTASNKVWNFQKCLEYGVNYYSIKESPESYCTREETRSALVHLYRQIENASQRSFLANLYRDIQNLKANKKFINNSGEKEFENLIFGKNGLLDQIFNLLILDITSEAVINQCLLLAFQILENYCDLSIVGNFGNDNSQLSSGYIWTKEKTQIQIFVTQLTQISTRLELVYGNFAFQSDQSNQTPISFNALEKMELKTVFRSGLDASSLVKMISILYFREKIEKKDIEKLMKLRYYRSNVAAHLTGNINALPANKITSSDIVFFIDQLKKIFIKITCNSQPN